MYICVHLYILDSFFADSHLVFKFLTQYMFSLGFHLYIDNSVVSQVALPAGNWGQRMPNRDGKTQQEAMAWKGRSHHTQSLLCIDLLDLIVIQINWLADMFLANKIFSV